MVCKSVETHRHTDVAIAVQGTGKLTTRGSDSHGHAGKHRRAFGFDGCLLDREAPLLREEIGVDHVHSCGRDLLKDALDDVSSQHACVEVVRAGRVVLDGDVCSICLPHAQSWCHLTVDDFSSSAFWYDAIELLNHTDL